MTYRVCKEIFPWEQRGSPLGTFRHQQFLSFPFPVIPAGCSKARNLPIGVGGCKHYIKTYHHLPPGARDPGSLAKLFLPARVWLQEAEAASRKTHPSSQAAIERRRIFPAAPTPAGLPGASCHRRRFKTLTLRWERKPVGRSVAST